MSGAICILLVPPILPCDWSLTIIVSFLQSPYITFGFVGSYHMDRGPQHTSRILVISVSALRVGMMRVGVILACLGRCRLVFFLGFLLFLLLFLGRFLRLLFL